MEELFTHGRAGEPAAARAVRHDVGDRLTPDRQGDSLSGADGVRLWHDQLLYKPVDAAGTPAVVGWHTDRQYWMTCDSEEMLTAWVGFHDVDETRGSVSFLAGSHRWDVTGLDFFSSDLAELEARIVRQGYTVDPRPARMRRARPR